MSVSQSSGYRHAPPYITQPHSNKNPLLARLWWTGILRSTFWSFCRYFRCEKYLTLNLFRQGCRREQVDISGALVSKRGREVSVGHRRALRAIPFRCLEILWEWGRIVFLQWITLLNGLWPLEGGLKRCQLGFYWLLRSYARCCQQSCRISH